MERRTLLGAAFGLAALIGIRKLRAPKGAATAAPAPVPVSYAAPIGGSGTAKTWQWVALPNSGGLQVYCTAAYTLGSVAVQWTADGVVGATFKLSSSANLVLTVAAPAEPGVTAVASGGPPDKGCGLTVRRT
jgi:hypothetical protein